MISELQSCTELINTHLLASYCSRIDVRYAQAARLQGRKSAHICTKAPISLVTFPTLRSQKPSLFLFTGTFAVSSGRDASHRPQIEERSGRFIVEAALQHHLASGGITISNGGVGGGGSSRIRKTVAKMRNPRAFRNSFVEPHSCSLSFVFYLDLPISR